MFRLDRWLYRSTIHTEGSWIGEIRTIVERSRKIAGVDPRLKG